MLGHVWPRGFRGDGKVYGQQLWDTGGLHAGGGCRYVEDLIVDGNEPK